MSDTEQFMSRTRYELQYFFEVTCEYAYDLHKDNYKELLYKAFPELTDAIDVKLKAIEEGKRIREVFTQKDAEMEKILK